VPLQTEFPPRLDLARGGQPLPVSSSGFLSGQKHSPNPDTWEELYKVSRGLAIGTVKAHWEDKGV
jgi:hypothetical protein